MECLENFTFITNLSSDSASRIISSIPDLAPQIDISFSKNKSIIRKIKRYNFMLIFTDNETELKDWLSNFKFTPYFVFLFSEKSDELPETLDRGYILKINTESFLNNSNYLIFTSMIVLKEMCEFIKLEEENKNLADKINLLVKEIDTNKGLNTADMSLIEKEQQEHYYEHILHLSTLIEISNRFRLDSSLEDVQGQLTSYIVERLGFSRALLFIINDNSLKFHNIYWPGSNHAYKLAEFFRATPILLDWDTYTKSAIAGRTAILVSKNETLSEFYKRRFDINRSVEYLTAPIFIDDEPYAIITADLVDKKFKSISPEAQAALSSFASSIGIIMQNIIQYRTLKTQVVEMNIHNELAKIIGSRLDLESVATEIIHALCSNLEIESAELWIYEETSNSFKALIQKKIPPNLVILLQNLLRDSFRMEKTFRETNTIFTDNLLQVGPTIRKELMLSLLRKDDEPFGFLVLGYKKHHQEFSSTDKKIIDGIYKEIVFALTSAKLMKLATVDGLTGLAIYRHFREKLHNLVSQGEISTEAFSLILIGIDEVSLDINAYKRHTMDRILMQIGRLIRKNIRNEDFAARYQGTTFAVILEKTKILDAKSVAIHLIEAIRDNLFETEDSTITLTASAGVTTYMKDLSITELLRCAELALKLSHQNGGDQVSIYQVNQKKTAD